MGGLQFEITPMKPLKPDACKSSIVIDPVFDGELKGTETNLRVKTLTGKTIGVKIGCKNTVSHVKCVIREKEGIPVDQQQLVHSQKQLEDGMLVSLYKITRRRVNLLNRSDTERIQHPRGESIGSKILHISNILDQEATLYLILRLRGGGSGPEEMVIAAGGSIKQNIVCDKYKSSDWRRPATVTFNLQLLNSLCFEYVTGIPAPPTPVTAAVYAEHGFPFFDMYEEPTDVHGDFAKVKSIAQIEGRIEKSQSFPLVQLRSECHAVVQADVSTKSEIDITELVDDPDRLLNTTGPFNQLRTVTRIVIG